VESRRFAALGTVLIALNPRLVLYGNYFLTESLYLPLGTLIFALLVRIPRRPWFLVGAMALAGAAVACPVASNAENTFNHPRTLVPRG
jgi:hypothetical protein